MGYGIRSGDSEFFIAAADLEAAYAAGNRIGRGFAYMRRDQVVTNIRELFDLWRFEPRFDPPLENAEPSNLVGVEFVGENAGDEEDLFRALAPFVRSGSYLVFHGEDGDAWRLRFEDGKFYRDEGALNF